MGSKLTFILGGARSGKSRFAQQMAEESGKRVLFVATATAGDEEMASRIQAHRASRPAGWRTLEAPLGVGRAIHQAQGTELILVDCLTLLTSNVLMELPEDAPDAEFDAALMVEIDELIGAYRDSPAEWVVISNEVGLGLVPPYPMGRLYRDGLGKANQRLAQEADVVLFMVAGIPMRVRG
jgi:adenosylcobinamide kinase/adenosylcobinamide-phosphate guanylyltransferase